MTKQFYYRLDHVSIVDVGGADAATIVHNLTTNEVKTVTPDSGRETFVTDVRGKTLGHVHLFRHDNILRLIGAAGQSQAIAAHVDRYTIREDAVATVRDNDFVAIVLPANSAAVLSPTLDLSQGLRYWNQTCGDHQLHAYQTRWLGDATVVVLVEADQADAVCRSLVQQSVIAAGELEFHHARTLAGFPWYGIDLDASNLPQEADRDAAAVSFTKGCYLGQETVARLDALGQVQKKLVRWSIEGAAPTVGTTLTANEKTVGRLTSIAAHDGGATALGFARRSHFDPGAQASGRDEATGTEFTATVIA